ncbi:flavin monoamine oxidase family protein [Sulfitobacter guttiformis]|uniref:Monoamine oxidase n=1 Tax=Sulfitobacter guttiformis TaxID=74349 RepID=A0A420DN72_9RHOB|nr:FAD-dependent oxidoreductase [Sulfitobacter guttiformis]KIN73050.1 Flavin monoamine oxidase family protein [Sulfitobacter guttiformis KCTC 32187]RKE95736.1 monoamine oxidase [Sulfitobacter guttiformis]
MNTLIVGGGLSGLALAEAMEAAGQEYLLVEARARFGGRIKTALVGDGYFDLGPAWFWEGQPRIAALVARLGLEVFGQYASGALTFEDAQGQVQRGRGFSSMEGSLRINGGLGALTEQLAEALPAARKRAGAAVVALERGAEGITARLSDGSTIEAQRVVLALPPRIATRIRFSPALPDATTQAMEAVPTWMAGQAKAVAIYERAFWREAGQSGDATSRRGPMVEIHDASPESGGPYALFGFVGVPPEGRRNLDVLRSHICAQLGRLFGPSAAQPAQLIVKDWAADPFTATDSDLAPLFAHPVYTLPATMRGLWEGNLHFAGTEVAPQFGGYAEGALEAAEAVLSVLPHD